MPLPVAFDCIALMGRKGLASIKLTVFFYFYLARPGRDRENSRALVGALDFSRRKEKEGIKKSRENRKDAPTH